MNSSCSEVNCSMYGVELIAGDRWGSRAIYTGPRER